MLLPQFHWLSIKLKPGGLFHHIGYDYSRADWDDLRDHLEDVPWEDILKLRASDAAVNFVGRFRLELMYTSFIESISSSLAHHSFQLIVLLP